MQAEKWHSRHIVKTIGQNKLEIIFSSLVTTFVQGFDYPATGHTGGTVDKFEDICPLYG